MAKEIYVGTQFAEGDAVGSTSKGPLLFGATGISGLAKALRVNPKGQLMLAPNLVTVVPSRPSAADDSSIIVLAANAATVGGFIVNNTNYTWWLNVGATAVIGQGYPLMPGGIYNIKTQQDIHGIHDDGGTIALDVFQET